LILLQYQDRRASPQPTVGGDAETTDNSCLCFDLSTERRRRLCSDVAVENELLLAFSSSPTFSTSFLLLVSSTSSSSGELSCLDRTFYDERTPIRVFTATKSTRRRCHSFDPPFSTL
jgi:hypothetical protein